LTVLPDTSIWIDYFRGTEPTASAVATFLERDEVTLCGPVVAELLAGTASAHREALFLALAALPVVDLDLGAWRESGEYAHELRQRGDTVPILDVLIAVAAVRADAALWTRDGDFERVRRVLPELVLQPDAP
jgi:predicted nucleic acid-binding protein